MSIRIEVETEMYEWLEVDPANLPAGISLTAEAIGELMSGPGRAGVLSRATVVRDERDRYIRVVEVDEPNPAYSGDDVLFGDPPPRTITRRVEL